VTGAKAERKGGRVVVVGSATVVLGTAVVGGTDVDVTAGDTGR